ncbi:TonB-dependent receptor [Salinisphaera sp. T31B1]|uniref:TonB-dependent receptor n=1 Tax=Salinisphaera sp. T31B1 TaxID=727963 RepID=UPI0033416409
MRGIGWLIGLGGLAIVGPASAQTAAPGTRAGQTGLAPIAVVSDRPEGRSITANPPVQAADTAAALQDVPGAALLDNGRVSGQAQYRGLSGYRNNVRIDGMGIDSGGPNWMDPPLHYAPAALVERVRVTRGIPSVADSVDAIGTVVEAETDRGDYAADDRLSFGGRLSSTIRSVDNGHSVGGRVQAASRRTKVGLSGATDRAGDTRTPFGRIRASSVARDQYGLDFGHRSGLGETTGFVRHQDTGRTGTPSLPLDIEFFDTTLAQLGHRATLGRTTIETRVSFDHVDHRMTNFELRRPPDFSPLNGTAADRRFIDARSQGYGAEVDIDHRLFGGTLSGGFDTHLAQHDATVGNPDNPMFFVDAFDAIRRDYYSGYTQWAGPLTGRWTGELGARYTHVVMDAGPGGVAAGLPRPAQNLAAGFASADRHTTDDNVDVVARLARGFGQRWTGYLGLGRKTRSPYYIERYAYIPLEATAGLADGNNHVGDIGLAPEVAYEINLGTDFEGQRLTFSPQLFYRRVNDYITGVAVDDTPGIVDSDVERVSAVNGDPTPLRYANVEAELYGADLSAGYALAPTWQLEGGGGYTRGRRVDTGDDLYRIAPANLRARLIWSPTDWRLALTQRYVFAQHRVSETHADARLAEPETAGYALTDVSAAYRLSQALTLTFGIDNLFDKGYRDFLAGYNRAGGGDIPVGARLPGAGRNAYASLAARF